MNKRKISKAIQIIKLTKLDFNTLRFCLNLAKRKFGRYKENVSKNMPFPTTIMLELTNKCNLHCVTCPREHEYGKSMKIGSMDSNLAKKIIDQTYVHIQSIGLTGLGETLYAKNLLEIAEYVKLKKPSIITFISTNANFPDFIDRIKPVLPYIDTIQISIDGIGGNYERIRKGGSFRLFDENLKKLSSLIIDYKIDVIFNMVITQLNFSEMANVIEYAANNNILYVNFSYFNLASITDIPVEYYEFFKSDKFKAARNDAEKISAKHPGIEVTGLDFIDNSARTTCPLLWNHFQINHDGEVPPCCAKPFSKEYSFGNIKDNDLIEVLNSNKAKQFRQPWINGIPNKFCEKCHFVQL